MTPTAPVTHRHPIEVAAEDVGLMGHVNNASYLKWVQAAVIGHWRASAPQDAVAAHLWIALKHEITYRKPAFGNDVVFALTLLTKSHGTRAFYDTIIRRCEEVLTEVHSSGCCVAAETLRPARLPRRVVQCFDAA